MADNFFEEACLYMGLQYQLVTHNDQTGSGYRIQDVNGNIHKITISDSVIDITFQRNEINKIAVLFHNGIFQNEFTSKDDVIQFISTNFPDSSPAAKADRLLLFIHSFTSYDGQLIDLISAMNSYKKSWRDIFFTDGAEFDFYYDFLAESNFIKLRYEGKNSSGNYYKDSVGLTFEGLKKVIEAQEKEATKTCFVAMSFVPEMFSVYEQAIKPAIKETGFEPVLITETGDIPSDVTINDAILAAIKKSKFTIADFTDHKHGVYFESGFALGRGQKVIYTCKADQIGTAHFDTRNYPHLLWKDAEDLKKKLIDKIEVFIKS